MSRNQVSLFPSGYLGSNPSPGVFNMVNNYNLKMLKKVVIVTTTLYNSKLERDRSELAKETIKKAVELGYEIIVFDGGSPNIFLKEIKPSSIWTPPVPP